MKTFCLTVGMGVLCFRLLRPWRGHFETFLGVSSQIPNVKGSDCMFKAENRVDMVAWKSFRKLRSRNPGTVATAFL